MHWPIAPYRAALRAVLNVETDAELGFRAPVRRRPTGTPSDDQPWTRCTIVTDATTATEWDVLNRRDALRGTAAIGGAGLLGPLAPWLEPLTDGALAARRGAVAVAEVEAVEHVVATFRGWRSAGSGVGRTAVVGQLSDVAERLQNAPADALTDRVFLAAAELAKIGGSMAFDGGLHRIAQHRRAPGEGGRKRLVRRGHAGRARPAVVRSRHDRRRAGGGRAGAARYPRHRHPGTPRDAGHPRGMGTCAARQRARVQARRRYGRAIPCGGRPQQ